MGGCSRVAVHVVLAVLILAIGVARAQDSADRNGDVLDRPIGAVLVQGASADDERLIRNNLRAAVGDPFDTQTLLDDERRIASLGRFEYPTSSFVLEADGTVTVIYTVTLQPLIQEVQVVGNSAITDQELLAGIAVRRGMGRDDFLIARAKRDIVAIYRKKGYYLTEVTVNDAELDARGILIFDIVEGPRVRVKGLEFSGVRASPPRNFAARSRRRRTSSSCGRACSTRTC